MIPSEAWSSKGSPADILNVALIGCRNMGFGILQHHLSNPGVNCVALCDIDDKVLNDRAAEVQKTYNQKPKLFKDFRQLLEQKDIDAVIIGTPDHWHCLLTVFALQSGKHVICEKPLARTVWEVRKLVEAARAQGLRLFKATDFSAIPGRGVEAKVVRPSLPAKSAACRSTGPTALTTKENTASPPPANMLPVKSTGAWGDGPPSTRSWYRSSASVPAADQIVTVAAPAS